MFYLDRKEMLFYLILALFILLLLWFYLSIQRNSQPLLFSPIFWLYPSPRPLPKTVRILCPWGSPGIYLDAALYSSVLGPSSYIVYVDPTLSLARKELNRRSDINLCLERTNFLRHFPSHENWLMVNQEFFPPLRQVQSIDLFICKSLYAARKVETLCKKRRLKGRVYYTRHSSDDLLLRSMALPSNSSLEKDEFLFVHFAGKSPQKQTRVVIETFLQPVFSHTKLVVTCQNICYEMLSDLLHDLSLPPHIQIFSSLDSFSLLYYQIRARFHVCPSSTEGYGHYINEGRSAGGIIITLDAPPMNELVSSDNGILIPPRQVVNSRFVTGPSIPFLLANNPVESEAFLISSEDLTIAIHKALNLSPEKREKMSRRSRERYLEDRNFFIEKIQSLFSPYT